MRYKELGIVADGASDEASWDGHGLTAAILDTIDALIVVLDRDGRIVRFNPACERLTGYALAEVRGRYLWDVLLLPDDAARIREAWRSLDPGRFPSRRRNHWVAKGGDRRLIDWSNTAVVNDRGAIDYVIGTGIDVTERQRAEEALREKETTLRAVIDAVPAMINAKDRCSRYVLMNRYQAELYGLAGDEALGRTAADMLGDDYGRYTQGLDHRVIESGEPLPYFEEEYPGALGAPRTWLTTKVPIKEPSGRVKHVATVSLDITERKRMEKALTETLGQLRHAQQIAKLGYWVWDAREKRMSVPSQNRDILGVSVDELIGLTDEEYVERFVHPDDRARVLAVYLVPPEQQPEFDIEYRVLRPDGALRYLHEVGETQFDEAGEAVAMIGTIQDVTERRLAEERLRQAKEEAERANRAKSEFLATMSHELRTPLNAVIGFAEILEQELFGPLGDDRYQGYALDIRTSAAHLLGIINDILDLSKLEAGKVELSDGEVDLAGTIAASLRFVAGAAELNDLELATELAADLPRLIADERALRQVLLNVLSNAIKFSSEGGRVTVRAGLDGEGALAVAVADRGIGMTEDEIAKALLPFGQVDSALSRRYGGTGLGLPLARSLVELHAGRLEIESAPGHGTTVTVRFPRERVARAG